MNATEVLATWPASPEPRRLFQLQVPGRAAPNLSARGGDLRLIARAPKPFLDTTHFDTVRFPPPPWALDAFNAAAHHGENAYSPYRGHGDVLDEVADNVGRFLGVAIDPARNLIVTPGTQAGLFAALGALVEQGQRVALVAPDYLFSERILGFFGAEVGPVPLLLDARDGPAPDMDVLEEEITRRGARFLVFSHPNNPTGAIYSDRTIGEIGRLCRRHGVTVVADELYSRLVYGGRRFPHFVGQAGSLDGTVTLLGPSKTESLSGYRLGVVVGAADTIDRIENLLSIMSLRAPAYAQHLLKRWLRDDQAWLEPRLTEFAALQALTEAKLRRLPWLRLFRGQGTAYAWPNISALNMSSLSVAEALLEKAAVLVSPGYQFGAAGEGHFRICYARDEAEWATALDRMVSVLDELGQEQHLPGAAP